MSSKERVVFLDRAAFTADDLPIPRFDHNWSEYPHTDAADIVPRLFWATTAITHACAPDAKAIEQLHKLVRIVVTGAATVDKDACHARGIAVERFPPGETQAGTPGRSLIALLEALVAEAQQ